MLWGLCFGGLCIGVYDWEFIHWDLCFGVYALGVMLWGLCFGVDDLRFMLFDKSHLNNVVEDSKIALRTVFARFCRLFLPIIFVPPMKYVYNEVSCSLGAL